MDFFANADRSSRNNSRLSGGESGRSANTVKGLNETFVDGEGATDRWEVARTFLYTARLKRM